MKARMNELCAQLSSRRLRELSIRERSEEAVKIVYACRAGAKATMIQLLPVACTINLLRKSVHELAFPGSLTSLELAMCSAPQMLLHQKLFPPLARRIINRIIHCTKRSRHAGNFCVCLPAKQKVY